MKTLIAVSFIVLVSLVVVSGGKASTQQAAPVKEKNFHSLEYRGECQDKPAKKVIPGMI